MQENNITPLNGYMMFGILVLTGLAALYTMAAGIFIFPVFVIAAVFILPGFFIVQPNEAKALVLFGKYKGSVKTDGFHWAIPFYTKEKISLRVRNFNTDKIKVNDSNGNPVVISAVVVWRVQDTAKALFAVDNVQQFVDTQSEAALRNITGKYPYDNFANDGTADDAVTLRGGADTVSETLEHELRQRLNEAGVEILEARLNHLAYAEEIASAMLQRQQASAVVAARREIVDGAVGMVEMALQQLSERQVVELDEEKKAAMVSNLLVVLSGDQPTTPVVNAGTLHQ